MSASAGQCHPIKRSREKEGAAGLYRKLYQCQLFGYRQSGTGDAGTSRE